MRDPCAAASARQAPGILLAALELQPFEPILTNSWKWIKANTAEALTEKPPPDGAAAVGNGSHSVAVPIGTSLRLYFWCLLVFGRQDRQRIVQHFAKLQGRSENRIAEEIYLKQIQINRQQYIFHDTYSTRPLKSGCHL